MRLEVSFEPGPADCFYLVPSSDNSRPVAEIWFDLKEEEFMETLKTALGIDE